MPYYFAYGSCMNAKDLARTVEAEEVGVAVLPDYKLGFTRYSSGRNGGVADIIPSENDYVEGMLLKVPDFVGLDAREGHPYVYRRTKIKVFLPKQQVWVTAYTYEVVEKDLEEIRPSKEYAMLIWNGAKVLSFEYRRILKENILRKRKKYTRPKPVLSYRTPRYISWEEWEERTGQPWYKR